MKNRKLRSIAHTIVEQATAMAQEAFLSDVRLGLGYSAVQLNSGSVGISWSPKSTGHTCTAFEKAGTLVGRTVADVLPWLALPDSPWLRVVALATLNALLNQRTPPQGDSTEIITGLNLRKTDRVAMVGRFHPLLKGIRASGCHLDIIELEASEDDSLSPQEGSRALKTCTVALVTGTSLVTGTLDGLLHDLEQAPVKPRAVVLLGPSVPLLPEAFTKTPITHLAGSWVRDQKRVLQIVSEGGGTPFLKPSLDAVVIPVAPH